MSPCRFAGKQNKDSRNTFAAAIFKNIEYDMNIPENAFQLIIYSKQLLGYIVSD